MRCSGVAPLWQLLGHLFTGGGGSRAVASAAEAISGGRGRPAGWRGARMESRRPGPGQWWADCACPWPPSDRPPPQDAAQVLIPIYPVHTYGARAHPLRALHHNTHVAHPVSFRCTFTAIHMHFQTSVCIYMSAVASTEIRAPSHIPMCIQPNQSSLA